MGFAGVQADFFGSQNNMRWLFAALALDGMRKNESVIECRLIQILVGGQW